MGADAPTKRPTRAARARSDLGPKLIADRDAGLRWKMLVRRYGLSRSRLVQIFQQARRQGGGEKETVCPRCGRTCDPD